tara:strand:- start:471 stop:1541 length:1071 start_codon:yes stop_codon:yes gene_type:complete
LFGALKILGFVSTLLLLHIVLFTLYFIPAPQSLFDSITNTSLIKAYNNLPTGAMVRAKFNHALNHTPYAIGLFGNSRVIRIGSEELGLPEDEIFNFAVGGTSLLQSVSLLEALAKAGKAPELSIISIDHPELQYFGYPDWPPFYNITNSTKDSRLFLARSKYGYYEFTDAAKYFFNNLLYAWKDFIKAWNFDNARKYLTYLGSNRWKVNSQIALDDPVNVRFIYRADGSMRQPGIVAGANVELTSPILPLSKYSIVYLENYIIRLGRLVDEFGLRVVVYESPLHPNVLTKLRKAASPNARLLQERILSMCIQAGLDCRTAPDIDATANGPYWEDCCHAPAAELGHYIRTQIIDTGV